MKRLFLALGLIGALGASSAPAQARVSVSVAFGAPVVSYHPRYHRAPYVVYHPRRAYRHRPAVIVIAPWAYRPARVVVVRPRHYPRRHHGRRGDRDR